MWSDSDSRRRKGFRLKEEGEFRLDIRRKFFIQKVVRHWNRSTKGVVRCPILGDIQGYVGWSPGQVDLVGGNQPMAGGLELDGL